MKKNELIQIPIIILNWNGLKDTIECMDSVLQMEEYPFRVILIDNGSSEDVQQELSSLYGAHDKVEFIQNKENLGFTHGNNMAFKSILNLDSKPEFIALLNNDTVVPPDWINRITESAIRNKADMVSCKMINYYDRSLVDNLGHFMLNTAEILPLAYHKDPRQFKSNFINLGACGGAALYRTSMLEDIGVFDNYFNTGYEDAELGLRATLLGYKCLFEPDAVVYHKVSRSIDKIKDDKYIRRIQLNIFYTYFKLMPRRMVLFNFPFFVIKYAFLYLSGIIGLRFKQLMLYNSTLYQFFSTELARALKSRRSFYDRFNGRILFRKSYLAPTNFFLLVDFKRFKRIVFRLP